MDFGIFQLLPRGSASSDHEVIEHALWEVDFAERHHYDSVWVTEHHFSGYGSIGVPSVYAAAIAQRTKRIRIGYAVAVVPLHHPLRLAEEISWVDHLSNGRLLVGFGPGFSSLEFAGFGIPVNERHDRFREGVEIISRALSEPDFGFDGRRFSLRPRPFTEPHPPFYCASTSDEALRIACLAGMRILLGREPVSTLAQRLQTIRAIRVGMGVSEESIDREIGEIYVLRRVCIARTDEEACIEVADPLRWHLEMESLVHKQGKSVIDPPPCSLGATDMSLAAAMEDDCIGSVATVCQKLDALRGLGLKKVICWFDFGNMPHSCVRRSMQLMAEEIIPQFRRVRKNSISPTHSESTDTSTNGKCNRSTNE